MTLVVVAGTRPIDGRPAVEPEILKGFFPFGNCRGWPRCRNLVLRLLLVLLLLLFLLLLVVLRTLA